MGGKKKGKGSKLARMSEEERLRYLQHRAAIEEEARRRKEQLIATFMKNKLKREEAFSRLNVAKLNQQWRQTLRRYKCLELRQDLESLFKWFVHTASKKTKQIDVLLEDLDEAETQYSRIHQCHMEIIDRLLDIHKRRVDFFQKQYEQEWKEIYEKATNGMNAIVSSCTFDQDHLKAILFRMKETHCLNVKETVAKQTVKTDELRDNMLMELENLIVSRETRIEQLWQMIQTVLRDYWEETEDRRRQYISLRDADFENWKQIFHFYQQINHSNRVTPSCVPVEVNFKITSNEKYEFLRDRPMRKAEDRMIDDYFSLNHCIKPPLIHIFILSKEVIIGLKAQLFKARVNGEEKIQEVKEEREECNKLFKILRKQLDNDRGKDKVNLSFLTGSAQDATKALTKIHKRGEQIIQLLSLCKKLEVMKDQISPYIIDKNYLNEDQEKDLEESTDFREKMAQEVVINFSKLKNFWKRYNQALIEKESLALTVKSLEVEQKQLKNSVRKYLSDAVLIKPSMKIRVTIHRPFTTQTQKSSHSAMQERKVFSSVPYVEAVHSPAIREMIKIQTGK